LSAKHKNLNSKRQEYKKKRYKASRKQKQTWMWLGVGVAAIIIIVAAVVLVPKIAGNPQISVTQAYQKYQQGAFFLDVRTQAEWDQAHIANSTLIPLDELQSHINELPMGQDIIVVCLTGHRSEEGVTLLRDAGFSRARCMTGGLTAWKAAGYPLEGSNP
jgi:rhodanese-related sulfurtransferase